MPVQEITVNGREYLLEPVENAVNGDYYVQLPQLYPNLLVGTLRWAGNGETNFSYAAYDYLGEGLGTYTSLLLALGALDARLYPVQLLQGTSRSAARRRLRCCTAQPVCRTGSQFRFVRGTDLRPSARP